LTTDLGHVGNEGALAWRLVGAGTAIVAMSTWHPFNVKTKQLLFACMLHPNTGTPAA
jgi:hypothetical protein